MTPIDHAPRVARSPRILGVIAGVTVASILVGCIAGLAVELIVRAVIPW